MRADRKAHKTVLLQILKEIYTDTSLGPILGLKGCTAAHLFYDLGRFSVDLDFDLLDEAEENHVFVTVENILKGFGTIKEKYRKRHTIFFVLSYADEAQNIKVEVSRRSFGSRYELKKLSWHFYAGYGKRDMFAHKLVALLERGKTANRDIFDIWSFLKNNWAINKEIVEKRTGLPFKEYLKKCIDFIESYSDRYILAGMGELLDEKQKAWAKANLKKDVLFLLKVTYENES
jgi:Uncharacterized conserved protein